MHDDDPCVSSALFALIQLLLTLLDHHLPSSTKMASSEPSIYAQLIGMGVDEPIAQEASRRFKDMDHAANWAFDHGQTVRIKSFARWRSLLIIARAPRSVAQR